VVICILRSRLNRHLHGSIACGYYLPTFNIWGLFKIPKENIIQNFGLFDFFLKIQYFISTYGVMANGTIVLKPGFKQTKAAIRPG